MSFARILFRKFSTSSKHFNKSVPPWEMKPGQHQAAEDLWGKLTYFVAAPALFLVMLNTYLEEKEHAKHPHRAEFIAYDHLRIRNKKFPWGDGNHSLFHNAKLNALPDGYEEDL